MGVGVTSMAETVVLLGPDGSPATSSIAWHDTRGADEAEELADELGRDAFTEHTGLAVSSMCTLSKLAWLHRHGGPPLSRALNVADWVLRRFGAEQVAEASLASRTGALSLAERSWWVEALQLVGAPKALFPASRGRRGWSGEPRGSCPALARGSACSCRPRSPLRGCRLGGDKARSCSTPAAPPRGW